MAALLELFSPFERRRIGFLNILQESDNIISANHKHFLYLTLTLLLPLSASTIVSSTAYTCIKWALVTFSQSNLLFEQDPSDSPPDMPIKFIALLLLDICICAAFSLASTAAITQSVFRGHLEKDASIQISLNSISNSLTRLLLTGVAKWSFTGVCMGILSQGSLILFILFFLISMPIQSLLTVYGSYDQSHFFNAFLGLVALSMVGVLLYLNVIWGLAFVVAVLEEKRGLEALERSMLLVKGQRWLAFFLILLPDLFSWLMVLWSQYLLEEGYRGVRGAWILRFTNGFFNMLGWILLHLYSRAVGCVFYLSCKRFHNEAVGALGDRHLLLSEFSGEQGVGTAV